MCLDLLWIHVQRWWENGLHEVFATFCYETCHVGSTVWHVNSCNPRWRYWNPINQVKIASFFKSLFVAVKETRITIPVHGSTMQALLCLRMEIADWTKSHSTPACPRRQLGGSPSDTRNQMEKNAGSATVRADVALHRRFVLGTHGRSSSCLQSMIVVAGLGSNENRETFQVAQKMTLSMRSLDHPCVDWTTRTGAWFGHLIDMMWRWMIRPWCCSPRCFGRWWFEESVLLPLRERWPMISIWDEYFFQRASTTQQSSFKLLLETSHVRSQPRWTVGHHGGTRFGWDMSTKVGSS